MSDHEVSARITARNETAAGIGAAKASIEGLGAVTAGTTASMRESFASVSSGVTVMGMHIRETFALVGQMRSIMLHFGEAMLAAFAVERIASWAEHMGDAAEKTVNLAQTFGLTIGEVQKLGGIAAMTGLQLGVVTKGMAIFDKNLVAASASGGKAAAAFTAIGVSLKSGRTNMQMFEQTAEKFSQMADGPKKVALAMKLFGKSGAELIPILNMGAAGLEEFNRSAARYGLVNEVAVQKGMALADSLDESKLAMAGVANVMTDAFAPMLMSATDSMNGLIAAMVESYNSGGIAKSALDLITGALGVVGTAITETIGVLGALSTAFGDASSDMADKSLDFFGNKIPEGMTETQIEMNKIKGLIRELGGYFKITCAEIGQWFSSMTASIQRDEKVIWDAMHLDWDAVAADWKAGTAHVEKINADATSNIRKMWNDVLAARSLAQTGLPAAGNDKYDPRALDKIMRGTSYGKTDGMDYTGGGGGGGAKKGGAPKKAKESNVTQEWRAELATMLADEKNWGADEAQLALDFWTKKKAIAKKGSKELFEAEREVARAKIALFKEGQAEDIAGIKALEAAKLEGVKADMALERQALQNALAMIDARQAAGKLSAAKAVRQKADVSRELYQLDLDEAEAEYRIHFDALNAQLALEHLKPKARAEINRQIYQLQVQHEARMRVLSGQNAQKTLADERAVQAARRQNMTQLSGSWATALAKMATLQQGFMSTVKGLWQGLVGVIEGVLQQIISKFIMAQLVKLGLVKAETAATIPALAAQAGAGGVASMAAAPWPLDMTAPAFGAAMSVAAMSFAPLAAAEGGWDVPGSAGAGLDGRGGMSAIIHPREMVLPADLADVVRGGGAGGETHIHINAIDGHSVRRFAETHGGAFADGIKKHIRNGGRP